MWGLKTIMHNQHSYIYAPYPEITHLQTSNDEMVNYPRDLHKSTLKIQ